MQKRKIIIGTYDTDVNGKWTLSAWELSRAVAFESYADTQTLFKFLSIASVMLSNHLILCCPLLLLPSVFPSIRVFSKESAFCIRLPKYWSFSFSVSTSIEDSGLISFRIDFLGLIGLISLQSIGLSRVFSSTTIPMHQFFGTQPSLWSNSHICA